MRFNSVALISFALIGLSAAPAAAQDILEVAEPDIILDIAKGYGSAQLEEDGVGDPMISGRIDGMKYVVYFYGCTEGKSCRSIQMSTGYTDEFTLEQANEWNGKYRWIKAHVEDGSNFKMDVDLEGGVTREFIDVQFETWHSFVVDIKAAVGAE